MAPQAFRLLGCGASRPTLHLHPFGFTCGDASMWGLPFTVACRFVLAFRGSVLLTFSFSWRRPWFAPALGSGTLPSCLSSRRGLSSQAEPHVLCGELRLCPVSPYVQHLRFCSGVFLSLTRELAAGGALIVSSLNILSLHGVHCKHNNKVFSTVYF